MTSNSRTESSAPVSRQGTRWLWFHKLGSPPHAYRIAGRLRPWLMGIALLLMAIAAYGGLVLAPTDYQQKDAFRLIDVREDKEFAAGRLPGAEHFSKGIIERDIETAVPDPATEIVLYCGGGFRSALAAENLQRMGYTNVWSLAGGWREWAHTPHATFMYTQVQGIGVAPAQRD